MNTEAENDTLSLGQQTDFALCRADDISSDASLTVHRPNEQARSAVISADYPYRVFQQTPEFSKMFGFKESEHGLVSLRILFGPDTDLAKLKAMVSNIIRSGEHEDWFTFYKKNGDDLKTLLRGNLIQFDGRNACQLNFEGLIFEAGNDLPSSASKSDLGPEPNYVKSFAAAQNKVQHIWSPYSPTSVPSFVGMDRAVLLHIKAIRKAAASKGSAK
jgi:hypothetical protein